MYLTLWITILKNVVFLMVHYREGELDTFVHMILF